MNRCITFAVAVNDRHILNTNFLASPCLLQPHRHQILIQEGYTSAAIAYNDAIEKSQNDLIVFVHQDIILPEGWADNLERALEHLAEHDPNWGVLGTYGETLHEGGRGYVYSTGLGIMGRPFEAPARIQTLDEIVLIMRKSSGLRFDDQLPNFHMYGTDLCMMAESEGRKNYAISAFCIHNTNPGLILGDDFYACYWHLQRKWRERLPIKTTCVRITRHNGWMYRRKMGELFLRYFRPNKKFGGNRAADPQQLMAEVEQMLRKRKSYLRLAKDQVEVQA